MRRPMPFAPIYGAFNRLSPPVDAALDELVQVYNNWVGNPLLPKSPTPESLHHQGLQHRHTVYAAEATGLLIIAVVLLVVTIIRWWQFIPWSAR